MWWNRLQILWPEAQSIRSRLLLHLGIVFVAGMIALYLAATSYARYAADSSFDRLLLGSAGSIAETLSITPGEVRADIPYSALDMLSAAPDDRVFYRVVGTDGVTVTGYPAGLFDMLANRTVPEPRVAEIGSGTGLASEGLFELSPTQLTMIEPDPRLCAFLEQRFARPDARVICAPCPQVDIEGKFDLIACAAAFHWMDPAPALAKVKSLLAPSGVWAMWWNSYFGHGEEDAFAEQISRILSEERVVLPPSYVESRHYAFDVQHHIAMLADAGFGEIEHLIFRTPRMFTPSQARDLYRSFSFISVLPENDRERILQRIANIVDNEFNGVAASIYATSIFVSTS